MKDLPKSILVKEVVTSRYPSGQRPENWDQRIAGIDTVIASDGNSYNLLSDGQQSPPEQGWQIILRDGDNRSGYHWTLYGLPIDSSADISEVPTAG